MRVHSDWSTGAFEFEPCAPGVGPFAQRGFLETWWGHRGAGELMLVESDEALLPLYRERDVVRFLGESDLTDYHSPLGAGAEDLIAEMATALPAGTGLSLDSLPAEASEIVCRGLGRAGLTPRPRQHETAAVLTLPDTYGDYLGGLSSKERHEARRKGRRFTAALGEPRLVRDGSAEALDAFVRMHRSAPGDKGAFFDDEMRRFFAALLDGAGAVLDLLVASDETPVAAAFGFEAPDAYYLYNSSFDPEFGHVSPGVVMVNVMIEAAIGGGRSRFDFLKGDESYKFRLGGMARPLFQVEVSR
jgi:CelD/BcsL family acetyltransferase involved in cellulose biosynthesis